MKIAAVIAKILAAAAFIAGAVYLIATYGDKIVAWAKKMLPCKACEEEAVEEAAEEAAEETAEETAAEEPAEDAAIEVVEAAEVVTEETPVAEETDFVG